MTALEAQFYIVKCEGRQMLAVPRGDPMQVSEKHLEFMMTKVFTFPRNTQFDKVRVEEKLKYISIMAVF